MSEPDFLALKRLTLAYGGQTVVEALDLGIRKGELVVLLGPSGCGKTTTMRAIAGLLTPRDGRILLGGRDITRLAANKREVGLVFQSYALFPHMTVFDNVAFGLRVKQVAKDEVARRVAAAVASVGLDGFEGRLPKALSGGQQQRVVLARSIAVEPRLLLLDEPLSNLDARLRLEMRSELRRLQRELDMTMIYVTHDQAEALGLADRVVVMRAGRIEQSGPPQEIYERPRSVFVARFMGFENIFRLDGRGLIGENGASLPMAEIAAGAKVVAWRPQGVRLGSGPHKGTVIGASYLGQTVEYLIATPAGPIKAETGASSARFANGSEVAFDLPFETAARLYAE